VLLNLDHVTRVECLNEPGPGEISVKVYSESDLVEEYEGGMARCFLRFLENKAQSRFRSL
jgi:hypothetical protein